MNFHIVHTEAVNRERKKLNGTNIGVRILDDQSSRTITDEI